MAASSRFATVSEADFALNCFFFLFFEIITCVLPEYQAQWLSVNIHLDFISVIIHR